MNILETTAAYLNFIIGLIQRGEAVLQAANFVCEVFLHGLGFINQGLLFFLPLQQSLMFLLQFLSLILTRSQIGFQLLALLLHHCQPVAQLLRLLLLFLQFTLRSVR